MRKESNSIQKKGGGVIFVMCTPLQGARSLYCANLKTYKNFYFKVSVWNPARETEKHGGPEGWGRPPQAQEQALHGRRALGGSTPAHQESGTRKKNKS